MWQTIASGKTWKGEVCNRRKDGTFYWVDATILAFSQATGEPGYLAIRFDITARKQLEEQLIYNSKLASLGEMAAGLAHQLNNPLSIITGYVDVISEEIRKNQELENKLRKPLDRIGNGIRKLSTIVAGLRIFSRSSASKYTEKTLVQRLVEDTLMLCQERYLTNQVEVTSEVPSLIFECNRADVTQILLNLLNNSFDAVKSLPDRWIKVRVTQPNDDQIQFHIVDSGYGIKSEIVGQIMQPFFTTKEAGKYAGLGLSTSLGLARKYGGNLYLDRSSKNTHFVLELPMKTGNTQIKQGSGDSKAA
jgi:C4-dicarboxylate-specific signal transduction histidine kinase